MNDQLDLNIHYAPLWNIDGHAEDQYPAVRPLVAHYCSIATLEAIVRNGELWFSNPLYMNDYEELRFGMRHSRERFHASESIRNSFENTSDYDFFRDTVESTFDRFERGLVFDIYIACFSRHDPDDNDGRLSMWRGYGSAGSGAAIVFNTAALRNLPNSPLRIARIVYGTGEQRIGWIDKILNLFASLLPSAGTSVESLERSAEILFERLLALSIYTKHRGFSEEHEWRVVYSSHFDTQGQLFPYLGYHATASSVEPKLKWKIGPMNAISEGDVSLAGLIDRIILGPTNSTELAKMSVQRMLTTLKHEELAGRVVTSSTPFRARP